MMAGVDPNFNAAEVRGGLHFAMRMGSPNRQKDKATFFFRQSRVWKDENGTPVPSPRLDQDGNPFDPGLTSELEGRSPVTLDEVAVEFFTAKPEEFEVGSFRGTRVELTILDENWSQIDEAIEVSLQGGDRYTISYEKPVVGLFDIDVHQLVCFAKDES